ncbi:MAG: HAMP domain-containing histidine kinase [SAR116 cluster bacterium]|nr:MAG: HAMP domain-containing histidine kinase [SAR116 cluster bacterium]
MRHSALYPAILVAAFLVMVFVSALATTPTLYRQMAVSPDSASPIPDHRGSMPTIDLQAVSTLTLLGTSLDLILPGARRAMAVTGPGDDAGRLFDPDVPGFRGALRLVFLQWLLAGAAVSGLIVWLVRRFLERHYSAPLTALIDTINEFSDNPAVASPIPDAVTSSPEFLAAAGALDSLQRNTLIALRQRDRLADIGEAVAKINHDMRNVLSSATLVADTLIASEDPRVRRAAPHVVRSLEQSVILCQSMLDYLAETPIPEPDIITMPDLAAETATDSGITVNYSGPDQLYLDRTMMARILLNLARNAAAAGTRQISIDIWRAGRLGVVDIADDGPGIPRGQWEDLFLAFRSRQRGGTGLGLAIARDLAVAQGGNLKLTRSTDDGSEFRLQLPIEMFSGPTSADDAAGDASVAAADNRR